MLFGRNKNKGLFSFSLLQDTILKYTVYVYIFYVLYLLMFINTNTFIYVCNIGSCRQKNSPARRASNNTQQLEHTAAKMLYWDNTNRWYGYLRKIKIPFYKIQLLITSILSNCLNTAVRLIMPLWNHKLVLQRCCICYKLNLHCFVTTDFTPVAWRCSRVTFLLSQTTWTKLLNSRLLPKNDYNNIDYGISNNHPANVQLVWSS